MPTSCSIYDLCQNKIVLLQIEIKNNVDMGNAKLIISPATSDDIDVIYDFIHEMAVYEKCEEDFVTDKETLYTSLFELLR